MSNCKYETSNGRCGLKGSYAYRHKCYGEDMCRCNEPKTNADHIRSMTDEELADYMSEHSIEDFCYLICGGKCKAVATFNKTSGQVCREIVSNWLKQPYKEDT